MSDDPKAYLRLLYQELKINIPNDVSQEEIVKPWRGIWGCTLAVQMLLPEPTLLFSLSQPISWDVDRDGKEVVVFYPPRGPGSSNKERTQLEARSPMTRHEFVAATVIDSQAEDEIYVGRVCEDLFKNIVAYCEDQLINGDGSKTTGLLELEGTTSIIKMYEKREDFHCRALEEYAGIARRKPTHIVLANSERLKWQEEKEEEHAAKEPLKNLREVPIIVSDLVPEERGLIIAKDDIVLVASPLELKFGCKDGDLSAKGQSQIIASFDMGLAAKHPEAIAQLILEDKNDL